MQNFHIISPFLSSNFSKINRNSIPGLTKIQSMTKKDNVHKVHKLDKENKVVKVGEQSK